MVTFFIWELYINKPDQKEIHCRYSTYCLFFTLKFAGLHLKLSSSNCGTEIRSIISTILRASQIRKHLSQPGGSVGWNIIPYTKRLGVPFSVRTHVQVVGLIPSWGTLVGACTGGNQSMFLSLVFSLSLKSIKIYLCVRIKKFKKREIIKYQGTIKYIPALLRPFR